MNRSAPEIHDAVVVGGGFYGCYLALFLRQRGMGVLVLEKERDLLTRASYVNQARVHNGYHYPRNLLTAHRSSVNFPRFVSEFAACVDNSFEKVYAIARQHSKVNAFQFRKRCENIGAPMQPAPPRIRRLFNPHLIEEVFLVREHAFNAARLREGLRDALEAAGVTVRVGAQVERISQAGDRLAVELADGGRVLGGEVLICAYAQLNTILRSSGLPELPLKHEVAEVALIEPPPPLSNLGVTVMDGPFFSAMPFPARGLHSLTHVRYTPHHGWSDPHGHPDPHAYLAGLRPRSNATFMLRDAQRYLPALAEARHADSLFEVKTVLRQNEVDDGRPILMRQNYGLPGLTAILGGKIDNIYDALELLEPAEERMLVRG